MSQSIIEKLKQGKLLSEQSRPTVYVPTGHYGLNYVISGEFGGGIPVPGISQLQGESSTAKSAFLTSILGEAQRKGYYTIFEDAENTLSTSFAKMLGLDPENLIYNTPETIEGAFAHMEAIVNEIRALDKETPIVIGLDSLAVLCAEKELESNDYAHSQIIGAHRAAVTGGALRKFDKFVKKNNVGFIIVNQIRSKVGVMYGSPDTLASGGRSLQYYLTVDLKTISNAGAKLKQGDKIIGIQGVVDNKKNKCSIPFRKCEFKLFFDKGFDPFFGIVKMLDDAGIIERNGAWYNYNGCKFQSTNFIECLETRDEFEPLRKQFGIVKSDLISKNEEV